MGTSSNFFNRQAEDEACGSIKLGAVRRHCIAEYRWVRDLFGSGLHGYWNSLAIFNVDSVSLISVYLNRTLFFLFWDLCRDISHWALPVQLAVKSNLHHHFAIFEEYIESQI